MKAISYKNYGAPDVFRIKNISRPKPANNEILVKIHATTVTSGDRLARSLNMPAGFGLLGRLVFGIFGPRKKVLGTEFAGEITETGKNVTGFKTGDEIIAFPGAGFGGYAEYATISHDKAIAPKPGNLSYGDAVSLSFGGSTALNFLCEKGNIQRGEKVLIIGAAGTVGSAAVQLAKHFEADVTAVCAGDGVDMVRSIGADQIIDYTKEDFTTRCETYDIILDTSGTATYAQCSGLLKPNGRLLLVSANLWQLLQMLFAAKKHGKKGIGGYAPELAKELRYLSSLAQAGKFRPHVGKRFPLEQMAKAHAHVEAGNKVGNVVIMVRPDNVQHHGHATPA